jgi:ribosomal protein S12 methylthiotransferase
MTPTVYIENLGCAKNQVDAEIMGARMEDAGWRWASDPAAASLILINTCGFIEPAQKESIDTAFQMLAEYPETPLALTGCLAQRFSEELARDMPELAGVFGNREPDRIVEFVRGLLADETDRGPLVWLPPGGAELAEPRRRRLLSHGGSVFVKVAEGCDHHCSFCAIPSIRGRQRVRSIPSILEEFRELRRAGVFEFNLIAQDLAAWRSDPGSASDTGIIALLRALLDEPGEFWLRPLYLYPDTFPLEVVELSMRDERLLPYFDLSFQHGSADVLRRMGRPGDASRYLKLIESIRAVNPDTALRSSFIVGFPGETEEHFQELLDFLKAAELEWAGVFEFSPQEGTPAGAQKSGVVPASERRRRRSVVEELQEPITANRLQRFANRTIPVLLEERIEGSSMALGRSRAQAPEVDGLVVVHEVPEAAGPGEIIPVVVTGVTGVDLQARFSG